MFSDGWSISVVITDLLWLLVIGGWVVLILTGLEADKPLSGGLPGHGGLKDDHDETHWTNLDGLGDKAAWALFIVTGLSLPVVLWWIFAVHDVTP
jgi:hypothetical protein